jgi:glycosyltransferase involved in cell wall biosynthesis
MFNTVRDIACAVSRRKREIGVSEVVVGCYLDSYEDTELASLRESGVQLRSLTYSLMSRKSKFRDYIYPSNGAGCNLRRAHYARPIDTRLGYDFLDCDAWIFWACPDIGPIAPIRPYAAFFADCIPRVHPLTPAFRTSDPFTGEFWQSWHNCIRSYRRANAVFCTTPRTLRDAISYLGVSPERLHLVPHNFVSVAGYLDSIQKRPSAPYIVWPTNSSYHKNQVNALKALLHYYERLDGRFDVAVTGPLSNLLDEKIEAPSLTEFRTLWRQGVPARVKRRIKFMGDMPIDRLANLFRGAEFLWQNVIYDNGTQSAMEAGELGVPVLSSDYPQMRYWVDTYGLTARFFDPHDVRKTAEALKSAEEARQVGLFKGTFRMPAGGNRAAEDAILRLVSRLLNEKANESVKRLPANA